MKNLLLLLLVIAMPMIEVQADGISQDGIYYELDTVRHEAYVESVFSVSKHVSIPSYILYEDYDSEGNSHTKRYRVVGINDDAFKNCKDVLSVNLPNTIKTIGDGVFAGCTKIKSIHIPQNTRTIGYRAFANCISLSSVIIDGSLPEGCGSWLFEGCKNLKRVQGPWWIYAIDGIFKNCVSIENAIIPTLPITEISEEAYCGCTGLTEISIPSNIKSICQRAFMNCTNLTSLTIPSSVLNISRWAFYGCSGLQSLKLGCPTINGNVFDAPNIKTITFLSTVEKINSEAFDLDDMEELSDIYCMATNPPSCTFDSFYSSESLFEYSASRIHLYVPYSSIEKYKFHPVWSKFQISYELPVKAYRGLLDCQGVEANAVTADGVSQLMVCLGNTGQEIISSEIRIYENGDNENRVEYNALRKLENGEYVYVYTAPKEFPEDVLGYEYPVRIEIKAQRADGFAISGTTSISVVRAGVVLLHGLFSDENCFDDLKSDLVGSGCYETYQIDNEGYKATNSEAFSINKDVPYQRAKQLFNQLLKEKIVSTSYDFVGHSMGGILARLYAQEGKENIVRRIITLNTPHGGSQFGTLITQQVVPKMKDIIDFNNELSIFSTPIQQNAYVIQNALYAFLIEKLSGGAINDLMPSSSAMQAINRGQSNTPVHSICSYMSSDQDDGDYPVQLGSVEKGLLYLLKPHLKLLSNKLTMSDEDYLKWVLCDEKHDGIVPYKSQTGGLPIDGTTCTSRDYPALGPLGFTSAAHHIQTNHNPETLERILFLLKQPTSSKYFNPNGFRQVDIPELVIKTSKVRKVLKEGSIDDEESVKLSVEVDDEERILHVKVESSKGVNSNIVLLMLDKDKFMCEGGESEYEFNIPETYAGTITVCAIGMTPDGKETYDATTVEFEQTAMLINMFFDHTDGIAMSVGESFKPKMKGLWSNFDMLPIMEGVVLNTDCSDMLQIEGSRIIAKQFGQCKLIATMGEMNDTTTVTIFPSFEFVNAIKSQKMEEQFSVKYEQGRLTILPTTDEKEPILINIYDITGKLCMSCRRKNHNNQYIYVDVSTLKPQLYIVRVSSTKNSKNMKFVR